MFQENKASENFRKTNISYPLTHKMFVFRNTRFEIRFLALLPTIWRMGCLTKTLQQNTVFQEKLLETTLQIMQNIYPASWFYFTGHSYVRSMFVKHHFVAVVVCLFVIAVIFTVLIIFIIIVIIICLFYYYYFFLNWYKLDRNFFAEQCKFFQFQIKK